MKKGQFVTYKVHRLIIRAIVRHVHRDGTVTVEARHELDNGKPTGGYLGYRYRYPASLLRLEV